MPNAYYKALTILSNTGPEYGEDQANIGPATADALVMLDRPGAVVSWIDTYRKRLGPIPSPVRSITRNDWRSALGDISLIGDWVAFFQRELHGTPWQAVLRDWIPRLAPGLSGAAGQGLLRTSCVLRNISIEDSELLREELAVSLGYWAARFLKLPGLIGSAASGSLTPAEALSRIKWQHKERSPRFTNIITGLQGLSRFSPFAGVINLVAIPSKPSDLIRQTTAAMARLFLSNSYDPVKVIPFIHALVIPHALRYVVPYVEPPQVLALLRYGWQFAGAMYAIYGRANPAETCELPAEDREQLIDRAITTGNELAIIYMAACLREYALDPQPFYLAAAREAVEKLQPADER